MWCIPPEEDAEFACRMEQVLEVYKRPYDPCFPVVCMDEQPKQLISEKHPPMALKKANRGGLITNTSGKVFVWFGCLWNRWVVGEVFESAHAKQRWTGRSRSSS